MRLKSQHNRSINGWFEEQVERSPEAAALVYSGQILTYAELNQQANQLARYLQKLGVKAETPVAFCLERSFQPLVAILAILKAGGAYVPIDPVYPRERIEFKLKDAGISVLIAQAATLHRLPALAPEMVCVDLDQVALKDESAENLSTEAAPDQAAYIIYTSGSTGRPKGVVVTHHNVVRLFSSTAPEFGFGESDVWTLFHSLAFDFSVWEIWGALLYGGRLVVVPYQVSQTPTAFYQLLLETGVTVLNQTPSAFGPLMQIDQTAPAGSKLKLRWIFLGGEALALGMLKPWFERHGDRQPGVVNLYGITETTVIVTWRPIRSADLTAKLGSVIGSPIPNWTVHLLDAQLQPVAAGGSGEIFVGGPGVARGYLNRPELDAERFLADPFSTTPGVRLYRSGDLARRLDNGELVYLGRADQQVKIRGFRIELGEVEAALHRHPDIQQAAVISQTGMGGGQELAAWLVLRPGNQLTLSQLRAEMSKWLPGYMIPEKFTVVKQLPLSASGKVDRRALESLAGERLAFSSSFVAPRTDTERRLCAIWQEVLEQERVGIHDNFFEIGGRSLLALNITLEVERTFGRELPIATIFSAPTIAELAFVLEADKDLADLPAHQSLHGQGQGMPLFYLPSIAGYEFLPRAIAQRISETNRYYDGFQYPGLNGKDPIPERVEDLAAALIPEFQRIWPSGPACLCGYSFGGIVAFELARQLKALGREVPLVLMLDSRNPAVPLRRRTVMETLQILWKRLRQIKFAGWLGFIWELAGTKISYLMGRQGGSNSQPAILVNRGRMAKSLEQAHDRYQPGPYDGKVVLFQIEEWEYFEGYSLAPDPLYGWEKVARGGLELVQVPGGHYTMLDEPNVSQLANQIQIYLDRARRGVET